MESVYWFVPQSEECLITDEEKKELQSMVLSAAESVSEIYVDIVISDAPNYSSGISDFTSEQRKVVVEHLGSKGLVSVEEDTYMQNSELSWIKFDDGFFYMHPLINQAVSCSEEDWDKYWLLGEERREKEKKDSLITKILYDKSYIEQLKNRRAKCKKNEIKIEDVLELIEQICM